MKKVNLQKIVESGITKGVQSIFLFPGSPPLGNKKGILKLGDAILGEEEVKNILKATTTDWLYARFMNEKELDYSYELEQFGRFRINAFFKRGSLSLVMRPIPAIVPDFDTLGLPDSLKEFTQFSDGLILITGPTGSGKSTTLASLIDIINRERACHIVTIEDPIEFHFSPAKSIISQREVGRDTKSAHEALRRVLREDSDVIVVHEIRDMDSMRAALEMAETGHLVFSTLHTINVSQTINRIVDFFPEGEKNKIRLLISQVLKGVISQQLVRRIDGRGFVCAVEVMKVNPAIKNLIKEEKIHQIYSIMDVSKNKGMVTMNDALLALYKRGFIDMPEVIGHSSGEKGFIEKVIKESPQRHDVFTGKMFLDLERGMITYEADFSSGNLSHFDTSGILLDTPLGLLFRDRGQLKENLHFIADYTILNGKKPPFPLKSLFKLSYKILDAKIEKHYYTLRLRVVIDNKNTFDIPEVPVELTKDGDWHTLTIPIPEGYKGKEIKHYMLLFDNNIKEIVFNNINFI